MIDTVWKGGARHSGHALALVSSVMLITSGMFMLCATAMGVYLAATSSHPLQDLFGRSWFPIVLYMVWGLGVFGTAGAICAIAVYGFRERWFWRWLVVAAATWLISPPAHMVIGLISLLVLLRNRDRFPRRQAPAMTPP